MRLHYAPLYRSVANPCCRGVAIRAHHTGWELHPTSDHQLSNSFATQSRVATVSRERVALSCCYGKADK